MFFCCFCLMEGHHFKWCSSVHGRVYSEHAEVWYCIRFLHCAVCWFSGLCLLSTSLWISPELPTEHFPPWLTDDTPSLLLYFSVVFPLLSQKWLLSYGSLITITEWKGTSRDWLHTTSFKPTSPTAPSEHTNDRATDVYVKDTLALSPLPILHRSFKNNFTEVR